MYALRISCNILNMLLAFAVFVLTTKPAELVEDLEQAGFSPKLGYVISSVFQIIPQMSGTMNTIMDAQKDILEQARLDQPYLTKLCQQLGYKKLYFSLE